MRYALFLLVLVGCDAVSDPAPPKVWATFTSTYVQTETAQYCTVRWEAFSAPPIHAAPTEIIRYVLMVNGNLIAGGSFLEGNGAVRTFIRPLGSYALRWRFDYMDSGFEDFVTGSC